MQIKLKTFLSTKKSGFTLNSLLFRFFILFLIHTGLVIFQLVSICVTEVKAPFVKEQIAMEAIETLNRSYCQHLARFTGYHNVPAQTCIALRDSLYEQAIKLFPEDDGIRFVWWGRFQGADYIKYQHTSFINDYKNGSFTEEKRKRYKKCSDEIYNQLISLENVKKIRIKNSRHKYQELYAWFAASYINWRTLVYGTIDPKSEKFQMYLSDKNEIIRMESLLNNYSYIVTILKKYDLENIDNSKQWNSFYTFLIKTNQMIVVHQLYEEQFNIAEGNPKFDCKNTYVRDRAKYIRKLQWRLKFTQIPEGFITALDAPITKHYSAVLNDLCGFD